MLELTTGEQVPAPGTSATASAAALVSMQVGYRRFPWKTQPRCKTCRHPKRQHIEAALIEGFGYSAIIESLGEHDDLSYESLRRHVDRGHSALELIDTRARLELHASQVGINVVADDNIITTRAVLGEVITQGWRDLVHGGMPVRTSDLLKAVAMQEELTRLTGQDLDAGFAVEMLEIILERVGEDFCPREEEFSRWKADLAADPAVRALMARRAEAQKALAGQAVAHHDDEPAEPS